MADENCGTGKTTRKVINRKSILAALQQEFGQEITTSGNRKKPRKKYAFGNGISIVIDRVKDEKQEIPFIEFEALADTPEHAVANLDAFLGRDDIHLIFAIGVADLFGGKQSEFLALLRDQHASS
ncbi:MAG: hypothetical protein ACREGI_03335 [Candidatus Levyibacteriota bacterium]